MGKEIRTIGSEKRCEWKHGGIINGLVLGGVRTGRWRLGKAGTQKQYQVPAERATMMAS